MAALNSGVSVRGAFIGVNLLITGQILEIKYLTFGAMFDIFSTISIWLFYFYLSAFTTSTNQLVITEDVKLTRQTHTELSFSWESNIDSEGYYRFEAYPSTIDQQSDLIPCDSNTDTQHYTTLNKLDSHSFYYFQSVNVLDGDTIYGKISLYSPMSRSSGEIQIFFNNDVNESVSKGLTPNGVTTEVMEGEIISKIDNAQSRIDYCIYNTHRTSIVDALKKAANRGVRVRVIYNEREESSNFVFDEAMPFSTYERLGDGLMHNKFLVIDAEDEDASWVMSGSTNFTDNQMDVDPNHVIFIQDKNLAQAYEIEFEEMWGSDGAEPDLDASKFGKNKEDNTPHEFMINGTKVELYFSPSDNVSAKINAALESAQNSIDAALLIFTKWETRDALLEEINTGTRFRAIIEDQQNSDEIITSLQAVGAVIIEHPSSAQMHHKYAIIDESMQNESSKVISGSHNWTHSADTRHDENLLIIHSPVIANIFQQEYSARWAELRSAVVDIDEVDPLELYPNPAIDFVKVTVENSVLHFKILDIRGALIEVITADKAKKEQLLNISHLDDGLYFVVGFSANAKVSLGTFIKSRK